MMKMRKILMMMALTLTLTVSTTYAQHPWAGKRVGWFGDSITDPRVNAGKPHYWDYLGDWLDLTSYVYAVSGRQWDDIPNQTRKLQQEHGQDIDAIVIFIGTNDYNEGIPIGQWYDEVDTTVVYARHGPKQTVSRRMRTLSMDKNTYRGRINNALQTVKQTFPTKQVVLLTPIHRDYFYGGEQNIQPSEAYQNKSGIWFDPYVQSVKEAANIWAVPVIDLNALSGLYPAIPEHHRYYNDPQRDKLHPNADGHRRIALTLYYQLATLPCQLDNGAAPAPLKEIVPEKPDYDNPLMWYRKDDDPKGKGADIFYVVSTWEEDWKTSEGRTCHYADVWNRQHRDHMTIEISKAAEYMAPGNRFYAPLYRHTTMETWITANDDTIRRRTSLPMNDVCQAFDHFQRQRDQRRPFVIVGFSQGGKAVVELLKHMSDETYRQMVAAYVMGFKVTPEDTASCHRIRPAQREDDTGVTICYNTVKDTKFVNPVIANTIFGINPVNWRTDATPAILHDSITVTLSPEYHVLVVSGYDGAEYKPYRDFLNVGDIHSCEPWLYSESIQRNIALRTSRFRRK